MYRDLIEKTEEYLRRKNIDCLISDDLYLPLNIDPNLANYLFDYLENHYLLSIPDDLRKECKTLQDVYDVTETSIFRPAACMETYAILNALNIGYKGLIPISFIQFLADWIEAGGYRWDVPEEKKARIRNSRLDELDFSDFRLLPGTEFYIQDAAESYLFSETSEDAQAVKQFPPETKDVLDARLKEPYGYRRWPFGDDLPVRFRYPAKVIREAEERNDPIWELRIVKSYEKYLVLKHRAADEYKWEESVFVKPDTIVTYCNGKEKIEFFDYIRDENGIAIGIYCLIEGGDGVEEKEFRIEELYLHKASNLSSVSDTLINHYYSRSYEIVD